MKLLVAAAFLFCCASSFRIKKHVKSGLHSSTEEERLAQIAQAVGQSPASETDKTLEVLEWQAEAGMTIGATITASIDDSDAQTTFAGLRLGGIQGDARKDRCMLTLIDAYVGSTSYDAGRIAQWLQLADDMRHSSSDDATGDEASIFEFVQTLTSEDQVRKLNPVYLQSMGLMSERVAGDGNSLTIDLESPDASFTSEMTADGSEVLSVHAGTVSFSIRKTECSGCGDDQDLGFTLLKEYLKNRIDMCKVFDEIELEARSPSCNSGVAATGVTCQRSAVLRLSHSSVVVLYGEASVPAIVLAEQEGIMHKLHSVFHRENATEQTKVLVEDVEGLIEDKSEDCLSGKPDIVAPACWQINLPEKWNAREAVTFVVGPGQDIKTTILSIKAVESKLEIMKKIHSGDASGGHCKSKGGQTCLKYPASSCLEVPENPCPEGTGCLCQHASGPVFFIAWVIEKAGDVLLGTVASGGHIAAGFYLAFHPPRFGAPGPSVFALAGAVKMIQLGGRFPICTCHQLPCSMNHALNKCQVYPQSGVVPFNEHYCLPEVGWKCTAHSARCKMKRCSRAEVGLVGRQGQSVMNCQSANATREEQLHAMQESGMKCSGVAGAEVRRSQQRPPWSPLDLPFGLGMRVN